MSNRWWVRLGAVFVVLLTVDWALGALCAAHVLPLGIFLAANIPFGVLYVVVEMSWQGTRYELMGHVIGDMGSFVVFGATVILQTLFYFGLWEYLRARHSRQRI